MLASPPLRPAPLPLFGLPASVHFADGKQTNKNKIFSPNPKAEIRVRARVRAEARAHQQPSTTKSIEGGW